MALSLDELVGNLKKNQFKNMNEFYKGAKFMFFY